MNTPPSPGQPGSLPPSGPPEQAGGQPQAVPTCFRHPGRETYVSCVRCGRPACPDCLRSAAVGQQCVECIREGSRTTRRPAGMFGGRAGAGRPVVTWSLIAINVVLWIYEQVQPNIQYQWAMQGAAVASGQWYRLISSAFLPPAGFGLGILDIAFNMWALLLVGPAIENVLGRVRFGAVYLVSAIGGSVAFYFLTSPDAAALGASGAIFGLFAAWFVLARRLRADSRQVVALIAINLALDFFVFPGQIAWQAHVGGLIAGGLLTAAFAYAPRQNRTLLQAAATIVMLAILIAGVVIRDSMLVGAVRL